MLNKLLNFLGIIVAVTGSLWIYDNLVKPVSAPAQAQTGLNDQAVERIASVTSERVVSEMRSEQQSPLHYMRATQFMQGLTMVGPVKAMVAEFYLANGRFPSTNSQLGMARPKDYANKYLREARVMRNGIIYLTFHDVVSAGETNLPVLIFEPSYNTTSQAFEWTCLARNINDIKAFLPECGLWE